MSNKLAAVPTLAGQDMALTAFAETVKQNLDWISGQNRNAPRLRKLDPTATLVELIAAHNHLLERIQNP